MTGNGDEKRRHSRFVVEAIILAPTIPDSPLEAEDISAGGFKASFSEPPAPEITHEVTILLPGTTFQDCQARVAWTEGKETQPPSWAAGLLFLMEESERARLTQTLERLASEA